MSALLRLFDALKNILEETALLKSRGNRAILPNAAQYISWLERIIVRHRSETLYLGVIGEFSCGKSSFCNAFLGKSLFAENVLPGLGRLPAIALNAEHEGLHIQYKNGLCRNLASGEVWFASPEIHDFVEKAAILPQTARTGHCDMQKPLVEQAGGISPASSGARLLRLANLPNLPRHMVLVDTPGLAFEKDLSEQSRKIAAECDVLFALSNIITPLGMDIMAEARNLFRQNGANIIFVGSKADLLNPCQSERMAAHFAGKLREAFGGDQKFYFVSSLNVLDELEGKIPPGRELAAFSNFRKAALDFIDSNHRIFKTNTAFSQLETLCGRLMDQLLETRGQMARENNFKAKHDVDLSDEALDGMAHFYLNKFAIKIDAAKALAAKMAEAEITQFQEWLKGIIMKCENGRQLRNYLRDCLEVDISCFAEKLRRKIMDDAISPLRRERNDILADFCGRLEARLAVNLPSSFSSTGMEKSLAHGAKSFPKNILPASGLELLASDLETEESVKIGGGLAAGLGLAAIFPGIGWLAGGILALGGSLLGAFFTKDLDIAKKDSLDQLAAYFSNLRQSLPEKLEKTLAEEGNELGRELAAAMIARKNLYGNVRAKILEANSPCRENEILRRLNALVGELGNIVDNLKTLRRDAECNLKN